MKNLKSIGILFFIALLSKGITAQNYWADTTLMLQSVIVGNDTLPNYNMKEVRVHPKRVFKNQRQYRKYTRLVYHVKKAYPFALIARTELGIMNDSLAHIKGDKDRKKYIKEYEKEMFRKYESGLRTLTMTQGRILIKLVYRELGSTSYELVKEYRGSFSAVFWQGIARLFGSNLKNMYDPNGEDAEIEEIVQMIEDGLI